MNYITKDQVTAHLNSDVTLLEFSHNVKYDTYLSQRDVQDFLSGDWGESVQFIEGEYLIIYENDALKNERYFNIDELEKLEIDELIDLLDGLENYYYDSDDKDSVIDALLQYTNEDYYEKHHQASRWYDLESDYTISGYHQGDSIAVRIIGNVEICEQYLTNLFYDAPIYGRLEIVANGDLLEEIYIDEYLNDSYTWDKVQVINNVSNAYLDKGYHVLLVEYLTDNLPEELDYI